MDSNTTICESDRPEVEGLTDGSEDSRINPEVLFDKINQANTGDETAFDELVFIFEHIVDEQIADFTDRAQDIQDLRQTGMIALIEVLRSTVSDVVTLSLKTKTLSKAIRTSVRTALSGYNESLVDVPIKQLERIAATVKDSKDDRAKITVLEFQKDAVLASITNLDGLIRDLNQQRRLASTPRLPENIIALRQDEVKMTKLNDIVDEIILRRRPFLHQVRSIEDGMPIRTAVYKRVGYSPDIPGKTELDALNVELAKAKAEQQGYLDLMLSKWGHKFRSRPMGAPAEDVPHADNDTVTRCTQCIAKCDDARFAKLEKLREIYVQLHQIHPMDAKYPERQRQIASSDTYTNSVDAPLNINNLGLEEFVRLSTDTMETDVANGILFEEIMSEIDKLPPRDALVIKLRYFGPNGYDPLTRESIGNIIGRHVSTVTSSEHSALGKLRRESYKFQDILDV